MDVNLVCPVIVLENEVSLDIRKNDVKKLKVLVDSQGNLVNTKADGKSNLKDLIRDKISDVIGSSKFHLEQVYALGENKYCFNNDLDVIYLAVTNKENVKKLDEGYCLVDFSIKNNIINFDGKNYKFETKEHVSNNNIEYYHQIDVKDIELEKKMLELIIAYKHLRGKVENSDIIFKFMGKTFTLEDVRILYEMIKEVSVDKSNFRKRIVKYCVEVDMDSTKKGYRPSKLYTFKVLKGDIWL